MGYNYPAWKFFSKCLKKTMGDDYKGKEMLEYGCQELKGEIRKKFKYNTAKGYFSSIGFNHVSIDKKGCHRSLRMDLRKPFPEEFYNRFDIITNSGTTEHVKPLESQYHCFENIHNCAKVGCVMFHVLPGPSLYKGHCRVYYKKKFFHDLAKLNNYKIIHIEAIKKRPTILVFGVCFVKMEDTQFCESKNKFLKNMVWIDKETYLKHRKNKRKYLHGRNK